MSRKKHNVFCIKPEEPKFIRDMKIQAGYKEGPTIETKREQLPEATDKDFEDTEEEQPVVVVLKSGDLSAEEAAAFQKRKDEEEANKPADLSKPIIFSKSRKISEQSDDIENNKKFKKSINKQKKAVLSFNDEEDEDYDISDELREH